MADQPRTAQQQKQHDALAMRVLILGINSFIFSIVLFISVPLAIATFVLGAVALKEGRIGKSKTITGMILAGASMLIFIPLSIYLISGLVQQVKDSDARYNNPDTSQRSF